MTVLSVIPGQAPVRMVLEETLEAMQNFVGGTIQAIYPFDDAVPLSVTIMQSFWDCLTTVCFGTKMETSTIFSVVHSLFAVRGKMILYL